MDAKQEDAWEEWNPMKKDYFNKSINIYEKGPGAKIPFGAETTRNATQRDELYPLLIIKQPPKLIDECVIRNYFRSSDIKEVYFKEKSRIFFVYFNDIVSFDAALAVLQDYPLNLNYEIGGSKTKPPINVITPEKQDMQLAKTSINYDMRTIPISGTKVKRPKFQRAPLVSEEQYHYEKSWLTLYDTSHRYLNVKYEFALENLQKDLGINRIKDEKYLYQYRSGRVLISSNYNKKSSASQSGCSNETSLKSVAKICVACSAYSDISCKICSLPFCNLACFGKVYEPHKESCRNLSGLHIFNDSNKENCAKFIMPPSGTRVQMTAFEQTNIFYVRSIEMNSDMAYAVIQYLVFTEGKLSPKLKSMPKCGDVVIYKFDSEIVRAMVLNVDKPDSIFLVCIDYGNIEITTLENLYECSESLANYPRYAVPVQLKGVPNRYMRPDIRHLLYTLNCSLKYVLHYSESDFNVDMGMQRVVLYEDDTYRSLNRLLKLQLTPPTEMSLKVPQFKEDYLETLPMPIGENLDLIIMDNSFIKFGLLNCTTLDYAYEITKMQSDIQSYGESMKNCSCFVSPKGRLCIALYEGEWNRGVCVEQVGDGFPSIFFLDYGNITPVHVSKILPYPALFKFPILTSEFELIEFPKKELSKEVVTKLEERFAIGKTIKCEEISFNKEENTYTMQINGILEEIIPAANQT